MYIDKNNQLQVNPDEIPCLEDVEFGDPRLMALQPGDDANTETYKALAILARRLTDKEAALTKLAIQLGAQKQLITELLSGLLNKTLNPDQR